MWDPPLDPGLAACDVDSANREIAIEDKEELLSFELQLKLPAQSKKLQVRVSHINSPSSFYIQLTQDHSQLSRSADRIFELRPKIQPKDLGVLWWNILNNCTHDVL